MKLPLTIVLCSLFLTCNTIGKKNIENNLEKDNAIGSECMKIVLKRDQEFGEIRNHSSEQISLSETIDLYTSSLKSLDYSNCPEKFRLAFDEHINAWLGIKLVSDKYPEIRGELHDLFTRLENSKDSIEFKIQSKKIWDTWNIIEIMTKD